MFIPSLPWEPRVLIWTFQNLDTHRRQGGLKRISHPLRSALVHQWACKGQGPGSHLPLFCLAVKDLHLSATLYLIETGVHLFPLFYYYHLSKAIRGAKEIRMCHPGAAVSPTLAANMHVILGSKTLTQGWLAVGLAQPSWELCTRLARSHSPGAEAESASSEFHSSQRTWWDPPLVPQISPSRIQRAWFPVVNSLKNLGTGRGDFWGSHISLFPPLFHPLALSVSHCQDFYLLLTHTHPHPDLFGVSDTFANSSNWRWSFHWKINLDLHKFPLALSWPEATLQPRGGILPASDFHLTRLSDANEEIQN